MLVLLGESGVGKSTIEKYLCDNYKMHKIVSYTTRPIRYRDNEMDGIDYNFITEEKFLELVNEGFFAEYYTAGNGWHYGINKQDCTDDKVCVVTPHGLRQLKEIEGLNIFSVYVKVGFCERMRRIWKRNDNKKEIFRRIFTDLKDFWGVEKEVSHVINNEGDLGYVCMNIKRLENEIG